VTVSYAATRLTGCCGRPYMDGPEAHPYQTYVATRLREADEKHFGCHVTPCHALYPLTAAQQPVVNPFCTPHNVYRTPHSATQLRFATDTFCGAHGQPRSGAGLVGMGGGPMKSGRNPSTVGRAHHTQVP
jgi:hypothetical protein